MLKIKDDVKLSKLKKYGFNREKTKYVFDDYVEDYGYYYLYDTAFVITVDKNRRITFDVGIEFNPNEYTAINSDKWAETEALNPGMKMLYDLIKADLIEKVDD